MNCGKPSIRGKTDKLATADNGIYGPRSSSAKSEKSCLTKVTQKTHIIALHANTGRYQETPCHSLGIEPNALEQGHVVLLGGGPLCILNDLIHGLGLVQGVLGRERERNIFLLGDIVGHLSTNWQF